LTIFNKGAYLSFKSIFHKAFSLYCEIRLTSVPGTNQWVPSNYAGKVPCSKEQRETFIYRPRSRWWSL